jgi:hypothetical protein
LFIQIEPYTIHNKQQREIERELPEEVEVQQTSQKENMSEDSEELFS